MSRRRTDKSILLFAFSLRLVACCLVLPLPVAALFLADDREPTAESCLKKISVQSDQPVHIDGGKAATLRNVMRRELQAHAKVPSFVLFSLRRVACCLSLPLKKISVQSDQPVHIGSGKTATLRML